MLIKSLKKPRKTRSVLGNYSIEAYVKTDAGFEDKTYLYFETKKEANEFYQKNKNGGEQ